MKQEETTRINYRGIPVDITITWDYFRSAGLDHIEVQTLDDHPIPLTKTGYRSHFCHMSGTFTMDQAIEWFYQENGKRIPTDSRTTSFLASHMSHTQRKALNRMKLSRR